MIKRFLYFKNNNIIEKGEIKNLYLFNRDSLRIPYAAITPVIEKKFIHNCFLEYLIHPANIPNLSSEKEFHIKIGFLFSKDKEESVFGIKFKKYMVLNPIVLKRNSLSGLKDKISIFINGKKKLSKSITKETLNNIDILDFYSIIDKIFYNSKQFDAVLEKTGIIVSFKTNGG